MRTAAPSNAHNVARHHGYTILRIKRKRTEEPLDALVVESRARRKKSRGGAMDVFSFAQTVEVAAWHDEKTKLDLQDQISKLSQGQSPSPSMPLTTREPQTTPDAPRVVDEASRRYTIQQAPKESSGNGGTRRESTQNAPPRVVSARELAASKAGFTMYDAIPADDMHIEDSSQVDKFLPMLQEYLIPSDLPREDTGGAMRAVDYVWDVFYRRACSYAEWTTVSANAGAVTGLPPSSSDDELSSPDESEAEDDADEDSNTEEYYKNDYPDEFTGSDLEDSDQGSDIFHEASGNELTRLDDDDDDVSGHLWQ